MLPDGGRDRAQEALVDSSLYLEKKRPRESTPSRAVFIKQEAALYFPVQAFGLVMSAAAVRTMLMSMSTLRAGAERLATGAGRDRIRVFDAKSTAHQ